MDNRPAFAWRFLTPAGFFFALVALALPWLEVRMVFPEGGQQRIGQILMARDKPLTSMTLISQSGLQSMYGGFSWGPVVQQEINLFQQQGNHPWAAVPSRIADPAPFAIGYGILLVLGMAMGLSLPLGHIRSAVVLGLVLLATAMLALQVGMQFPLEQRLAGPDSGLGPQLVDVQPHLQPIRYTPMFYLACSFAVITLGMVLLEWYLTFGPGKSYGVPALAKPLPVSPYAYDDEDERPSRRGDRMRDLDDEEPR